MNDKSANYPTNYLNLICVKASIEIYILTSALKHQLAFCALQYSHTASKYHTLKFNQSENP